MQLAARLMPSVRLAGVPAASKGLHTALRAPRAPAKGSVSGAWAGSSRGTAGGGRRLHAAAAASQEQLARQTRDNEQAEPTTIADPGQNPLFRPYLVGG